MLQIKNKIKKLKNKKKYLMFQKFMKIKFIWIKFLWIQMIQIKFMKIFTETHNKNQAKKVILI